MFSLRAVRTFPLLLRRNLAFSSTSFSSGSFGSTRKPTTPVGKLDDEISTDRDVHQPQTRTPPEFRPFPNNINPVTGERDGPTGPEPTRYGDWERKGRCSDF
ncbi:unnamed protein product [Calicophoron daubneyi]|uniref:Succinate dehydrogenase assembly factor 4, mitochondrial n=1 Tax=Calicophoron daubneyi TaxID=300641 RepID=A0AAV2SYS7_CALDB